MPTREGTTSSEQLSQVAYVILGYVGMHPEGVHGYRLGRALSRSPLGLPSLRLGQLYRVLHQLERSGCLESHVEASGSRPARYRFTVTPAGRSTFSRWLMSIPEGAGPIRDQLLDRLRFADRLPESALQRLLAEAVRECEAALEKLRHRPRGGGATDDTSRLHSMAVEARLAAERRWLDEICVLAGKSTNGNGHQQPAVAAVGSR
jgi:DNA-binding PadR family transcriptional regulator